MTCKPQHPVRGQSVPSWVVAGLCLGLLAAVGCVSEERLKKADGYY